MIALKIKTKTTTFEKLKTVPLPEHRAPRKPLFPLRALIRLLSIPDMCATNFSFESERMELVSDKPCLILMNHSAFIDLKIAYKIFFPKPLCVVSTTDSFIGKGLLMRLIGCIPTQKYVSDMTLMSDMHNALHEQKANVLMFPEAGYSFDGRASALPQKMGLLLKKLNVPVVTVITEGAFLRQPLYNELRTRKVKVSAKVSCILTPEEIKEKSVKELDSLIDNAFTFDAFARQRETKTIINTKDRAKGLERILYLCPSCLAEGFMKTDGCEIFCEKCGKRYEMDVFGSLSAKDGKTEFSHIPDWVDFERKNIRNELKNGEYRLETDVKIGIIRDYKALYMVGNGKLIHDENGFSLKSDDGEIDYHQSALSAHSVNSDFYWYTIGDVVGIGNKDFLYYCFPKKDVSVTKVRLAAEELYKIKKAEKRRPKPENSIPEKI